MFESVKNARMYLRINDGHCNGTVSISLIFPQQMCRMFSVIAIRTALSECTDFMLYLQVRWKLDIICGMLSLVFQRVGRVIMGLVYLDKE